MTAADLPVGSAPAPLPTPHFPSRLHAFVWRNWQLVPTATLARVVGATPPQIRALGHSLGLRRPPRIPPERLRRTHLTIIRRNWHLLPYAQLLDLLGCTADELAYTLREDDFFYVKLGLLKPDCAPLRYVPPTSAETERAAEIAAVVSECFPQGVDSPGSLFDFVAQLSRPPGIGRRRQPLFDTGTAVEPPPPAAVPGAPRNHFAVRFCSSYFSLYGDPLLDPDAAGFPEGYLARLSRAGVGGIWLQGVLYKLAPFPWEPALSEQWERRLEHLHDLVEMAGRHDLGVYLYLNEPRAMPLAFYTTRPEVRGAVIEDHASLCTSCPQTQEWLKEAVATVCRAAPDLAALFSITASENQTNCWSHGRGETCPRCGPRGAPAVLAEVNTCFYEGIQRAGSRARMIAWDWGWRDEDAEAVIRALPPAVDLQSVSEWSIPIRRGGIESIVGEYSLSVIGPGPRARRHWAVAREAGHRTLAKIQAANTWEFSASPAIPVVENTAIHVARLRGEGVEGLMLGWTLGGYPSANLEVVAAVGELPDGLDTDTLVTRAMATVARRRCGALLAPAVVAAWCTWSRAFQEFPYHGSLVYNAPLQCGPANLLWGTPTGYRATMVGLAYDDLDRWRTVYPPEVFFSQLEKVADGFDTGIRALHTAITASDLGERHPGRRGAEEELRLADAAAIHFRSVATQARFIHARNALANASPQDQPALRAAMHTALRVEEQLARRLHALQMADSRLGFEASNQYFYLPLDLVEKVVNCRFLEGSLPG